MFIDAHVHLRDFHRQAHKETIAHGLLVARDSGLDAVFDMPNTDPPIMTRELVIERLNLAKAADVPEVFYGLYMGLTADPEQVKKAVEIYREFPQVVGVKLYAGHSVGNLGVIRLEDQYTVYKILTAEGYDGALAVHAEKESELEPNKWNPREPISHCHARPEEAEIASIGDQLTLIEQVGFGGKLHIAHISVPGAVELVNQAQARGVNVSSGVCPHHLIYDWQQMTAEKGILWKMNPPLRSPESKEKMLQLLRDGNIDWIETDHAPHLLTEKTQAPFMSGIPGIPWWPMFEEYLRRHDFADAEIERLTFTNVIERFDLDISRTRREIKDRRGDYPFNSYKVIEKELNWEYGNL